MNIIKILLAPLVGGIIGYITNDLAIKMLFRPRKAIYIGKWHVPFTPGLIPQQKGRIAASIGRMISSQLLNADTIKKTIASEATIQTMRHKIESLLEGMKGDTRTIENVLVNYTEPEKIQEYKEKIQKNGTAFLVEKIEQGDLGKKIVQQGISIIKEKMQNSIMGMLMDDSFYQGIEGSVGKIVNDAIAQKAPELIREEIGKMEDDVLNISMDNLYQMQQKHMPSLVDEIVGIYRSSIDKYLDDVLKAVNIESIVVEKINSFDAEQLEQMIFGIMKRELNAIVYLGAALGFLMGFVNLLW